LSGRSKANRKLTGYTHQEQLDNADLWYKHALSFNEASSVLYEHHESISGGFRMFVFDAALSLELILKAILVAKGKAIPQIHTLRELCTKSEVDIDEDQKCTLDLLTESIVWAGRYPAPKLEEQWDNYHDNIFEKHIVRQQSGNTHSTLANPKRFPSLENYTKIWKICLIKYASIVRETEHD
jgi:HEPN domain-containing protein